MAHPGLNELLKQTSRSFYLTLRVLPARVRFPISLAYLLARTTDTIADTEIVPTAQRLEALQQLRARILGKTNDPLNFGELARHQGLPAERTLLETSEEALAALKKLDADELALVQEVLDTITSGQELDLQRFGTATGDNIIALQNEAELDDYTYRVAGCVGKFWTQLCRRNLFPRAHLNDAEFLADGIRFGKGLQLVNILRDVPADLRKGRCYFPLDQLRPAGLTPADLLQTSTEPNFRPLYNRYLEQASAHLAAGWRYTTAMPAGQVRVRLACAWPVLIGAETLDRLRVEPVLDGTRRVKISRAQVRNVLLRSILWYPIPPIWRRLARISAA